MKKYFKLFITSIGCLISAVFMAVSASADIRFADDSKVYFEEDGQIFVSNPGSYSSGEPMYSLSEITDPNSFLYQNSPTTGDVKALVFLVDFADYRNSSFTKQQVADVLNNTEAGKDNYPFDSVSAFYDRSSFGKLNLSYDVYGWYNFSQNRSYYFEELSYNDTMQEILDAYDDEIDYSQYDANDDGYIDLVYMMYTGPDEGYGSAWWSYVIQAPTHTKNDGESVLKFAVINLQSHLNVNTIAHETGHLFGLEDYYNTHAGIPTDATEDGGLGYYDLMDSNKSDHNIFSKLLLGWVEPEFVTSDTEINISAVTDSGAKAIIVTPQDNGIFSEYYIVEYYKNEKNNLLSPVTYNNGKTDGAVRIYHVDAALESGSYKYNNSTTEHKLIKLVEADGTNDISLYGHVQYNEKYYYNGMTFGINTAPSTDFYGGKYTGINITVNSIASSGAGVSITFENTDNTAPYVIDNKYQSLFGEYTFAFSHYEVLFNSSIYPSDNFSDISVKNKSTSETVPVIVSVLGGLNEATGSMNKYNILYFISKKILDRNSEYVISIPENALKDSFGNSNSKIEITVSSPLENNAPTVTEKFDITALPDDIPAGQTIIGEAARISVLTDKAAVIQLLGNSEQMNYDKFVFKVFDHNGSILLNKCITGSIDWMSEPKIFNLDNDDLLVCGANKYIIIDLNGDILSQGKYFDDDEQYPCVFAYRKNAVDVYKHNIHQVFRIFFDGSTERFEVTDEQIYSMLNDIQSVNDDYTELINKELADNIFDSKYNYLDQNNYINNQHINSYNLYTGTYYASHNLFRSNTLGSFIMQNDVVNKLLVSDNEFIPFSEVQITVCTGEVLGITPLSDQGYLAVARCRMRAADGIHNPLQFADSTLDSLYVMRLDKYLNVAWAYLWDADCNFSTINALLSDGKVYWITSSGTYVFDDIKTEPLIKHTEVSFSSDDIAFDAEKHTVTSSDKKTASELAKSVSGAYESITVFDMNGKIVTDSSSLTEAVIEVVVDDLYTDYYHFYRTSELAINEENFPDEIFRKYIADNFDTDLNGFLSDKEIYNIKSINVTEMRIEDFTGIEYFEHLESFLASGNNAKMLDLSTNRALITLFINGNDITELDLSKNTELTLLDCSHNPIEELNLKNNTKLSSLSCHATSIKYLDLNENINLSDLMCHFTELYCLDLSKTSVTHLDYKDFYSKPIKVTDNIFILSELYGFDPSRASEWTGAEYDNDNNSLINFTSNHITYKYDFGNGDSATFSFEVNVEEKEPEIIPDTFDITDPDSNVGGADIASDTELTGVLTETDSDADHIKLVVEQKSDVDTETEAGIASVIPEKTEIGIYLNIDLKKYIGTTDAGNISETAKPIEIRMELPAILKKKDDTVARQYMIVRIHNGIAELLEAVFDGTDISFSTDKFSDYAIVYKDLPYGDSNGDGVVTMADLLLLKQYMVKVPGKTIYKAASDVTADNDVTMADLLRLKQYMVKVPGITLGK